MCGVEVDRQLLIKRKKRSNAHTLEIEMLETATHKKVTAQTSPTQPQPSPILEKRIPGPPPGRRFLRKNTTKTTSQRSMESLLMVSGISLGTGFSVREMLCDGAEMLRAFFRRYAHARTGKLNLRSVFRSLDTSGDGMISSMEFRDLFREVNIHLTRKQLYQVVRLFDKDCDGRVSIDEFENWIMSEPVRRESVAIPDRSHDSFNVQKLFKQGAKQVCPAQSVGRRLLESGPIATVLRCY